jgi:hypothetical protein
MTDAPLCQRIAEALEAHHETTLRLQELAAELVDHCARMRALTDKLQSIRPALDAPGEAIRLPRVLQGGPIVREA